MEGTLVGAGKTAVGELVFNTSMTGYQEIVTDPSYHRQLVVLTQPEIGNYGCREVVNESTLGQAGGLIFRNLSPGTWHRQGETGWPEFLQNLGMTAISGVDTRRLTHLIRDEGAQNALIAPVEVPLAAAMAELDAVPPMSGANLVPEVSTRRNRVYGRGRDHIVILDFGIKMSTIQALVDRGCKVTQIPWSATLSEIEALNPTGILLSNGPGDPDAVPAVRSVIATLMDRYPLMGICLGFQIMALAIGGRTYKLPFGHHGGNHPVRWGGRVVITSQNHGFAVARESLDPRLVELTHESLFDGSLEGFHLRNRPVFGVQFHPEAGPGPHDCLDHFDYFLSLVRGSNA